MKKDHSQEEKHPRPWEQNQHDEEHEEFDSKQLPYFYLDTHGKKQSLLFEPENMRAHASLYSS